MVFREGIDENQSRFAFSLEITRDQADRVAEGAGATVALHIKHSLKHRYRLAWLT
ncbi:hypothetical protein B0H34DRAFT_729974, partial [Crassisporium funariophilum]